MPRERPWHVVPASLAAQHELVEPAQQPERPVPARRRLENAVHERLVRELGADADVERRAAARLLGLVEEELAPRGRQAAVCCASAAFACSAIAANATGSLTARSASIFRSSSIPALRHPATNWL